MTGWGYYPVGLPGIAIMAASFVIFFAALLAARRRREPGAAEMGGTRSRRSWIGVAIQGSGIGMASFGPPLVGLDPLGPKALVEAAIVALLMAKVIGLFFWASRTMGRNWSLVARTRSDHQLVTTGPFARVRHPIYVALFLLTVAMATAFGHTARLPIAIPLFALGTWLRIREEERLLRDQFGPAYDAYAARVKRFVPGIF